MKKFLLGFIIGAGGDRYIWRAIAYLLPKKGR